MCVTNIRSKTRTSPTLLISCSDHPYLWVTLSEFLIKYINFACFVLFWMGSYSVHSCAWLLPLNIFVRYIPLLMCICRWFLLLVYCSTVWEYASLRIPSISGSIRVTYNLHLWWVVLKRTCFFSVFWCMMYVFLRGLRVECYCWVRGPQLFGFGRCQLFSRVCPLTLPPQYMTSAMYGSSRAVVDPRRCPHPNPWTCEYVLFPWRKEPHRSVLAGLLFIQFLSDDFSVLHCWAFHNRPSFKYEDYQKQLFEPLQRHQIVEMMLKFLECDSADSV